MIDVLAITAIITALAAALCGHATQPFPLTPIWRRLTARLPAPHATETPRSHPAPQRAARSRPLWAHTQPLDYDEAA